MDLIPYYSTTVLLLLLLWTCITVSFLLLLSCDFSGTVSNGFNDTRLQLGLLLLLLTNMPRALGSACLTRAATFHVKTRPLRPSGSCCCYICTPFFPFIPPLRLTSTVPSEEEEEADDVVVVIVESLVNFQSFTDCCT